MPIQSREEAAAVARLLKEGKITGAGRAAALADLRAFDEQGTAPTTPALTSADAQYQAVQAQTEGGRVIASGVAEGARRVVGGIRQAAGSLQDLYTEIVGGKPAVTSGRNPLDASTSRSVAATLRETSRQTLSDLEAREAGIDPTARNMVAGAVELGATGMAPEAALPKATTVLGAILKNATAGAAGSAVQFQADNEKAQDIALSATLPAALSTFTSLSGSLRNRVARMIRANEASGNTQQRVENAQTVMPNFQPTLAQRTGIPELRTLEQASYNSKLVKTYADQTDKFVQDVEDVFRSPATGVGAENALGVARAVAEQRLKALKSHASQAWEVGMARVRELAKGQRPVEVKYFLGTMNDELSKATNPLRNLSKADLKQSTVRTLSALNTEQNWTKGMPVNTMADLLEGLTELQRNTDPVVKGFATRLRRALDRDVEYLATLPAGNKAVDELLDVRAEYARSQALARLTSDSAAYRVLGVAQKGQNRVPTPDELLGNFTALEPGLQKSTQRWLASNSPELLEEMRGAVIRNATQNSRTVRAAADSQVDLDALTTQLFDPKAGYNVRTAGLWTPEELVKFEGVKDGLRVIANQRPNVGPAGTPIKPEDWAINLVSRSGPFLARQVTRVLTGSRGADFFSDPRAYEYLRQIRSTSGPVTLAARMALLELLQTEYNADPVGEQTP